MVNVQTLHRRAARVLPEVIKTSGVLLDNVGQNELTAMLFPLRRKSAGTVLFRLSAEMLKAMASEPLAYLKGATQARAGLGRFCGPFAYHEWRLARIPQCWLPTLRYLSVDFHQTLLSVYFTTRTDGKALVAVIPDGHLAAYVWRDRAFACERIQ